MINNNGDSFRIPLVIDVSGTLRHAPYSGASDGTTGSQPDYPGSTSTPAEKVEFELSGTSGGPTGHSVTAAEVT